MKLGFEGDSLLFEGRTIEPDVRTFSQMKNVLAFPGKSADLQPDTPTYFMYRGAEKFGSIRYDITRILSLNLCGEHNKTLGHNHPPSKKGAGWPEIYEVLAGEAHFILQKVDGLGVHDALLLGAKKGEKLLIPPGYGHVTANPGKSDLVLANLVCADFNSDYSMYLQRQGACFYETIAGKLVKNKNYGEDFEIRKLRAQEFSGSFGVFAPFEKVDLLSAAEKKSSLEFLEKPETFY